MMQKLIIYITVFIVFLRSSFIAGIVPIPVYYLWSGFVALYVLVLFLREKTINYKMLLFIIIATLSIIINDIDVFYKPWYRLLSFLLFMIAYGPLVESKRVALFKINLFKATNIFLIIISIISFAGYILSFPLFYNRSGFSGLANQSMLLGPIAGFSSLISLNLFFNSNNKKQKTLYFCLMSISVLTCLLAASRAAFISLLISSLAYIYIYNKQSIGKMLKTIFFMFFIIIATSSIWLPYTSEIINKNEARKTSDDILGGRETMFIDRIEDFKESPIFGVGFASMKNTYHSTFNFSGVLEPGSGWLFMLSTLGVLGLILFVSLMLYPVFKILINTKTITHLHSLPVSILIFFTFHLMVEGYLLSTGSFLFFYLWLTIGLVQKRVLIYL